MIRTIEMPILHREIAEFLDPRIHEAAPGTPSFALHSFRIDDREYVMDCLPTTGLMAGYRIVETGERIGISLKVINDCNMSVAPNKLEVETFPDGSEPTYYELFNSEGMLCCCDGEVVTVVRTGVDENGVAAAWLYATDSNGEAGTEFSLPIEALKVGVFY